jgi:hypothetical protein
MRLPGCLRVLFVASVVRFFLSDCSVHATNLTYVYFDTSDCSGTPVKSQLAWTGELGVCTNEAKVYLAPVGATMYYVLRLEVETQLGGND